jgi:Uma2 family endonuclease
MGVQTDIPRDNKVRKARLSIEQYYRICDSGALEGFGKTELIEGEICFVNSRFMPHMRVKIDILFALAATLKESRPDLEIGAEGAIELGLNSVPEPDVFIFDAPSAERGAPDGSVKLVVEVSDATVRYDLGKKKQLYAAAAVPEYWVALVRKPRIERFTDPVDGSYRRHDSFDFKDRVDSVTLPGVYLPAGTLG